MVTKNSIEVEFQDDAEAITAHTCTGLLLFPRGVFTSYNNFHIALKAVISSVSFNYHLSLMYCVTITASRTCTVNLSSIIILYSLHNATLRGIDLQVSHTHSALG